MSRLKISNSGVLVRDLDLQTQSEWIMGRSSSCDFVLDGPQEISRQHLKISNFSGVWVVEVLSRFGELYVDGERVPSVELKSGTTFEVPPFSFTYFDETSVLQPAKDVSDKTFVGQVTMVPYLKVCDEHGQIVHDFRLEGHAWVGGRDVACNLFIDNVKFSRRHFEIRLEEGSYMFRDLGSSNGTFRNDEALINQEWVALRSGDVLSVADWRMYFELRDSRYDERVQGLLPELRNPITVSEEHQLPEPSYIAPAMDPNAIPAAPQTKRKKLNWVQLTIGLILIAGVGGYLMDEGETGKADDVAQGPKKPASAFDKLQPKQQQYVKDTYRLADRLFKEGRYEMARQEVAKIHQVIPVYEESKNLEKLAEVAIQTQLDQQRAEAQEREKHEMDEKIRQVVAQCRRKLNSKIEMKTIDDCLSSIIALNPEHPDILALKAEVDKITAERIENQERQAAYQALLRRQKGLYDKATALKQAGKPLEALVAYDDVVKSTLPDPQNYKMQSKREIASIQKDLMQRQNELEKEANDQLKSGNLKAAILTLKKAIEINPENETLKGRVNSALGDLKKQMQTLYQEGVLEESVGEVETAKGKWKKIIELSLPEEDYYKKARTKIKKYEAE